FTFPDSELAADNRLFRVPATLQVEAATDDALALATPRALLDGTLKVTGVVAVDCAPSQNRLRQGMVGTLKVKAPKGQFSRFPILIRELLEIATPEPKRRAYRWSFWVVGRPHADPFGIFPTAPDGELTLDGLLRQLGASRDEVAWDAAFTS